ncbi:MAG: thiamine-phosphate kinase [Abditibacteriota bacterium]|nr:thiamine-phosphate kinase [Abditibacteriota bacterium]
MKSKEEAFIDFIAEKYALKGSRDGIFGIGDDCAVIPGPGKEQYVITCDMLCEDTHFAKAMISPFELGWKSAAVNISDIAGMAGKPLYAFVSLGMPYPDTEYCDGFYRGLCSCLDKNDTLICGGDTVKSEKIVINLTVVGKAGRPVYRSGARPGDAVMLCGTPGASAAGLEALLAMGRERAEAAYPLLVRRHLMPEPVMCSFLLKDLAGAMMDVSDGISKDLAALCLASGAGACIKEDSIPVCDALKEYCSAEGKDPVALAVSGGEDYGLLFTCRPENSGICAGLMKENGVLCTKIGEITRKEEVYMLDKTGCRRPLPAGWQHFGDARS